MTSTLPLSPTASGTPVPLDRGAGARMGHLVVIGGNEDHDHDKLVLRRFVELCGREDPSLLVLLAGGADSEECWRRYDRAFAQLGVSRRGCVLLQRREQANDESLVERLRQVDGVFVAGHDARRLISVLGGSAADAALREALLSRGVCVAGTSAGAAALSQHLVIEGPEPTSGSVQPHTLGIGLGLLQQAVVDQHFSERQRLGRLLGVVAQNPAVLGIGIDEDTALVLAPDGGLEVVGDGAVTLVDGREMSSSFLSGREPPLQELNDVRLHLLPAGARYDSQGRSVRHRRARRPGEPAPDAAPLAQLVPLLRARPVAGGA